MSTLKTRLRAISDRILDAVADMTPRDRTLLMGLFASALLLTIGGTAWLMQSTLGSLESKIEARELALGNIRLMSAQYEAAAEQAQEIEAQLQKHAGTDLSSFLEKAATTVSVKDRLNSVREKSSAVDGNIEEKLHSVSLKQLTTEELAKFLYEIETSGYPLRIKTLKVKTRTRKGEKSLNVDMDISAFRVIEDGADGEAG